MNVIPAGHDHDIYWRNVGLRHQAKRSGTIMSIVATTILCFFWSIPMTLISSLTEIGTIKESLPKLGHWIEQYPFMEKLLAQLAPMLLLIFNETILPVVLKYFATWEGHISSSLLEASLFVKLGCFMVRMFFNFNFVISVISDT
jgi:calcium permeable stress-gated cation channel